MHKIVKGSAGNKANPKLRNREKTGVVEGSEEYMNPEPKVETPESDSDVIDLDAENDRDRTPTPSKKQKTEL